MTDPKEPPELPPIHPSVAHVLQFFVFDHLPPMLQPMAADFASLAKTLAHSLQPNPETTVAIRKLLEAKDAAVRSVVCQSNAAAKKGPGIVVPGNADATLDALKKSEPKKGPRGEDGIGLPSAGGGG